MSVTLKLIQVYVTDKNGKSVLDLTKDDFILYDDGKFQKLTEFEKHVLFLPASVAHTEESVVPTPVPPSPRLLNRKFFLFFDFAYNNPPGIRKMGEAAMHFLDTQVLPTDEIGVLSISFLKLLQIHLDLTTDHRKVRDFVSKIGLSDSNKRFEDSEDEYKRNLAAGNPADARPESKLTQKTVVPPEYNLIDMWRLSGMTYVDCLTGLAWALRSIQGQKNLIFFSEGIPYPVVYPPIPTPLTRKYENMLKEMQTSNVKIYSLYMGGITLGDLQTGAGTLSKTSDDTGGQSWGNMYNYKPFVEKINSVTGSYYVLGYPVTEKWDGKFHAIKVELKRPGCDVHAQNGYSNPKLFTDYTDLENKITLVDLALAEKPISQTPERFDMAALPRSTETTNNLLLAAAVPVEKLRATLGKRIEVVSLVFNQADEIVEMKRTEENFAGIKEKYVHFLSILSAVPPGIYKCRIVLRDLETGRAAVAGASATIPAAIATGIKLFPPLLVRPDRGALYFKAHGPSAGTDKKTAPPDLRSLLLFDPVQYAPYLERTLYRESEAWAVIRCTVPEGSSLKFKLTSYLFDKLTRDHIPMALTVLDEKAEKSARTFFVRMAVPDVEPDEYTLFFVAEDEASGARSEIACDFAVEDAAKKGGSGR